ncbi:hypothetical protein [Arcobacter sp. LA11]|nr:hypothetical protein [Arcobacter sp. LA11]
MSSFKRNEDLDLGKKNDILFLKSTTLLATLIIANYLVVNTIIS